MEGRLEPSYWDVVNDVRAEMAHGRSGAPEKQVTTTAQPVGHTHEVGNEELQGWHQRLPKLLPFGSFFPVPVKAYGLEIERLYESLAADET